MFSEKNINRIDNKFNQLMKELPFLQEEVFNRFKNFGKDTVLALKYLYVTMPYSDISNYPFDTFLDYAEHGIQIWQNGPYSSKIPEDIFLNYVLYHRVNEEEILPCRTFFYEKLKDRIPYLAMKEAVLEANYWCAEEVTYQSTDERTRAPIAVYHCGYGRCGEESTFCVSVLRSIGIPARQVYAPRWSHCDDNHAWVEVWCDGSWYFIGACEPEEILNKGWFTNASSRAMLIHSRWFDFIEQEDEIISKEGMVTLLNQLERYAPVQSVRVKVTDEAGRPVESAKVEFQILNYSELADLATLWTDEAGKVKIKLGLGSILIHVSKDDVYKEILIDTRFQAEAAVTLRQEVSSENKWEVFDIVAPTDSPVNTQMPSLEQKEAGIIKFRKASEKRLIKVKTLKNKEADKFLESDKSTRYLKNKVLESLTAKDKTDITAEILEEHLLAALPFIDPYEEKIFITYLLNPRIKNEPITKYRTYINDFFSPEEKEIYRKQPRLIWEWINKNIQSRTEKEHPNVVTTPVGCLKSGFGCELSKKILFVAIARTLGLAARLNSRNDTMEYWNKTQFISLLENNIKLSSLLLISREEKITWSYYQNYTIAKYNKGTYTTLKLEGEVFKDGQLRLILEPGTYRIITSNRLPNGNIFANQYSFRLIAGAYEKVDLSLREAKLTDMLENISISDFTLKKESGETVTGSELTSHKKRILLWLEDNKEPTEHILNELLEKSNDFDTYADSLVFIVRNKKSLAVPTIRKVINIFPGVEILYDDFKENIQVLGRRLYVDPDKLPLIAVTTKELNVIYAASGYNVGTGDMLLRLLREV
ncbi:transglutaminase-like domain-containing protein [Anaerocolumna sp. MB42-C2]|uniref:transglutaminase-like domain-containing protein n=1 Tax=Anaerocolumna sp. MB42-C2 TaxID=3070997 RepID=UPI0027DEEF04|nr:transglutaminase-like domain-containing protein [Anaerocolumna sp. MB42-C2]WMJ89416.1 transglutaminase-like domain-containing protein [Anaerocolumna sp. MB42-C2]